MNHSPIIVTGGAKGIGRAIAKAFHAGGRQVVVADRDSRPGKALEQQHERIHFHEIDLQNTRAIEELFRQVKERFGAPRVLINNAGLSRFKPLLELQVDEWDEVLNSNLRAAWCSAREFARHHPGGYGRIVNIASTRAVQSEPDGEAYSASKGGLLALTHALSMSLANTGITVNCISPGWIQTEHYDQLRKKDHEQHPSGRVGTVDDVARLCLFLCGPDNDFINGANYMLDGGMTRKMIYEE